MTSNEHCKQGQRQDGGDLMQKADSIIRLTDGDASSSSGKDEGFPGNKSFSDNKVEKQEYRKAANRKSAFESRLRRKKLIQDSQNAIFDLHHEKAAMKQEMDGMKLQLDAAMAENRQLRFSNMLMQQQLQHFGFVAAAPTMRMPMPTTPMPPLAGVVPDASLAAFLPSIPLPAGDWSSNAQHLLQMQLFQAQLQSLQAQLQGSNKTKDDVIPRDLGRNNGDAGHANQEETNKPQSSPPSQTRAPCDGSVKGSDM